MIKTSQHVPGSFTETPVKIGVKKRLECLVFLLVHFRTPHNDISNSPNLHTFILASPLRIVNEL